MDNPCKKFKIAGSYFRIFIWNTNFFICPILTIQNQYTVIKSWYKNKTIFIWQNIIKCMLNIGIF